MNKGQCLTMYNRNYGGFEYVRIQLDFQFGVNLPI